jgi:peptidoglycan-associated lipoprotein
MQTNKLFKLGMAALIAVTMAACSSTDTDEDMGSEGDMGNTGAAGGNNGGGSNASSSGAGNNGGLSASEIRERDDALATTVFYFEFDRSDLNAESREALVHHANRLKENSGMRIRLEGHADERGTREYNLALGERRAQAVERYLQVQGVSSNQMETISYGEESPVASGSSEASYSRNRRVEIQ